MTDEPAPLRVLEFWDGAEAYEAYMARWSRLVARDFLSWLAAPAGASWLDVGCGTGGLSRIVLETANPTALLGIDPSEYFVAYAREHVPDPRALFQVGKAQSLPVDPGSYDLVVSGLVLNFVPEAERGVAIAAMVSAARPHGTVAAYVWDYAEGMQLMRYFWDAAAELDPEGQLLDEGRRFPFCTPDQLTAHFRAAGLSEVTTEAIVVPTLFRDFDDYWLPFLGGQGSAPTYAVSLTPERRESLRELIRSRLPIAADGSIHLTARAWAVRGIRGEAPMA